MKKMNKILSVMMAAAMTVSMTACGGSADKATTAAAKEEATTAAAKEEAIRCGAKALYVSACSARETIDFYTAMGFTLSPHPIRCCVEAEPYDIQMECTL